MMITCRAPLKDRPGGLSYLISRMAACVGELGAGGGGEDRGQEDGKPSSMH
jgi:hypothetical protein